MQTIHHKDIIIDPDRQRRHFDEKTLVQLSNSIKSSKGLLQAIVLKDDGRTLVAGERRLRAILLLYQLGLGIIHNGRAVPEGHIPFTTLGALSEDDLVEAELEENILRENLTWQEHTAAVAKLHSLRVSADPKHTYQKTAVEIAGDAANNADNARVSESCILNEHLDDPEVAAARTPKEALKIVRKKAEARLTEQLAQNFNIDQTPHTFLQGDFRNFTNFLETSTVDVILTDPPYGIGADNFGDQAGASHGYDDSPEYFENVCTDFVVQATRVAKERAHVYAFCDPRGFTFLQELFTAHGWTVWATPLIWSKGNGMLPDPDCGPRRTYEAILYAHRGRKKLRAVYPDIITCPGLSNPTFGAEKPSALYESILNRSCRPGDLVWDPFVGAGPIFPAANKVNVRVIGTELNPAKYNHAKLRLNETGDINLEDL